MLTQQTAILKSPYKTNHLPAPETTINGGAGDFYHRQLMARNNNKVGEWTNERHLHFLNSMEASFVQSMFRNNTYFQPLDRHLPDSSESTEDSAKERRRRHSASDNVVSSERTEKKNRILSCQKSSEDQVVPKFENKR